MSQLFPLLDPPPGGLARLRERLAQKRPLPWWPLWAVAPAAAAVAWLLLAPAPPSRDSLALLALDLASVPSEPVSAVPGDEHPPVLQRLASSDAKVILYAVAPTEGLEPR